MADGITLNSGAGGATVLTDDCTTGHAQVVKLAIATDGSATLVPADANGLLVKSGTAANMLVTATLAAGTNTNEVVGDAAHDAAVAGNPVLVGGYASAAAPTDVSADGDVARIWTTVKGAVHVADGGSTLSVDDGGGAITVDGTVAVTNGGTFAVQVDGAHLTSTQLLDDTIIADDAAFTVASTKVNCVGYLADESSTDSVDEGDAGAARMTLDRKQLVVPQPHTGGGLTIFRSLDIDETEEEIKATAGCVYGMWVTNTATSTRFVKFYNATAANVTVGTTTPVITWGIPGNTSDDVSGLFGSTHGIMFDTAITVAATTGVADADTGAPAANDVIINVFYK